MKRPLACLLLVCCLSCGQPQERAPSDAPSSQAAGPTGTVQMIDSLRAIHDRTSFRQHPYEAGEKLKLVDAELQASRAGGGVPVNLYLEYGTALLYAGRTEEAIEVFENVLNQLPENQVLTEQTKNFHEVLALSYMRLGEQTNCILNHSGDACLLPMKGKGVYTWTEGSLKAIDIYLRILETFPDDLGSRWLLNVAYMTLGTYPAGVPAQYLIPPDALRSEYGLPPFENIAPNLGLDVNELAGGVIADDFNNDGLLDVLVSSWSMQGRLHYFVSTGDGRYVERTKEAGLEGLTGGLNLIQADYDNDGYLDFYVLRGAWRTHPWMGQQPNSLVRNNGDGTFTDVTIAAGLYGQHPTQAAVWLDVNADGWLDLFVGNETPLQEEPHPTQLFVNHGDGTFTDAAPRLGLDFTAYVKGTVAGDINNDGLPDLYVSILDGPNKLMVNRGGTSIEDWAFEDATLSAGVSEPLESFPAWFFDYDNDGWEDLFVASFDRFSLYQQLQEVAADYLGMPSRSDRPRLYRNEGGGRFSDRTEAAGLRRILPAMGCNFGDLDNDGFLDFYLGTGAPDFRSIVPNRMFRNNAGQTFQDVTTAGNFGHIQKGHGIAFADLDNDGDQDIYAVMGGSLSGDVFQNALFENPGNDNRWITLRLQGTRSNRSAIGARVRVRTEQEDGTRRDVYVTVGSGGSFGAGSLQQEIGLGQAVGTVEIAVDWPDGQTGYTPYGPVATNQVVSITEGQEAVTPVNAPPFLFAVPGHVHQLP